MGTLKFKLWVSVDWFLTLTHKKLLFEYCHIYSNILRRKKKKKIKRNPNFLFIFFLILKMYFNKDNIKLIEKRKRKGKIILQLHGRGREIIRST